MRILITQNIDSLFMFQGAKLNSANLQGANLQRAYLREVDLRDSVSYFSFNSVING